MKKSIVLLLILLITLNNSALAAASDYLRIDMNSVPLNSKLKKDYAGYKYEITNISSQNVNIVNAQITNGQDGAAASNAVDDGNGVGTLWAQEKRARHTLILLI